MSENGSRALARCIGGLRALPGVEAVTAVSGLPPKRPVDAFNIEIANYSPSADGPAMNLDHFQAVMVDYFETMGIPIVEGRGFEPADTASPAFVAVALGADRSRVLAAIMRHGLVLTGIGIVIGLVGAFGLNRLIASLLFGVRPADGVTMLGVVALVLLVAALACLRPAWRASRLDPNVALRAD